MALDFNLEILVRFGRANYYHPGKLFHMIFTKLIKVLKMSIHPKRFINLLITMLGFITLTKAQETSKFELKLAYEKKFDFKITRGRIADENIFPTIFVTNDNLILFINKDGKIKLKRLYPKSHQFILSEDAKYIGILPRPKDWWKKERQIEVYSYTGKRLCHFIPKGKYDLFVIICQNAKGIVVQKAGMDDLAWIDFYSREGHLIKSYSSMPFYKKDTIIEIKNLRLEGICNDFPHIPEFPQNWSPGVAGDFLLSGAWSSGFQDGGWIVLFRYDGEILSIKKMYGDEITTSPVISKDGHFAIYRRHTPYDLAKKLGLNNWADYKIKIYDFLTSQGKEVDITIKPVPKARTFAMMDFTEDSKNFWVINGHRFYFGDVQKGSIIYSWESPDTNLISFAYISSDGNYALCEFVNGSMFVINRDGKVVFEQKLESKIIDARIEEKSRTMIILKETGLDKYIW